jgi:protein phosphatase-4 regulatory subunit 3
MNGDGAAKDRSQSLLSTHLPATNVTGAGSTSSPSQQSPDSTSPNSTRNLTDPVPNDSTSKINSPSEPNGTIADSIEEMGARQQMTQDKGRGSQSAPEGGGPQQSVKAEEAVVEPVNAQIELLEHTPDVVVDDGQDWAPDGDHEMKRVKVSPFASALWVRDTVDSVYPLPLSWPRLYLQILCLSIHRCTN